jgi:hypothetical protein
MEWITLVLAVYAAALSTVLGYLTWRKDRHSVRFFVTYHRRHDWYGLVLSVVNAGFRPVTLNDAHFEQTRGSGYLNTSDETLGLPKRLDEGEQLVLSFHAEDIELDTTAFVIRDTHRREHRMEFTPDVRNEIDAFREFIHETEPRLFADGQQRVAAVLRDSLAASVAGGELHPGLHSPEPMR